MYIDKRKSKKHKWRIPEARLFLAAFLLGSPGIYLGMTKLRHKTKHNKFKYGIPAILIAQTIIIVYVYFKFIKK